MISFVLVGTNTMYNVNKEFGKYHEKRMSRKVRAIMSHLNYLKYDQQSLRKSKQNCNYHPME